MAQRISRAKGDMPSVRQERPALRTMSRASACPQYRLTADILAEAQEQRRKCSMMVIYRSTMAQANQYVEFLSG
jgi:hypothetical protein